MCRRACTGRTIRFELGCQFADLGLQPGNHSYHPASSRLPEALLVMDYPLELQFGWAATPPPFANCLHDDGSPPFFRLVRDAAQRAWEDEVAIYGVLLRISALLYSCFCCCLHGINLLIRTERGSPAAAKEPARKTSRVKSSAGGKSNHFKGQSH